MVARLGAYKDVGATVITGITILTTIVGATVYFIKNYPDKLYVDSGLQLVTCLIEAHADIIDVNLQVKITDAASRADQEVLDALALKEKGGLTDTEKLIQIQKNRDLLIQRDTQRNLQAQLNLLQEKIKPGGCHGK